VILEPLEPQSLNVVTLLALSLTVWYPGRRRDRDREHRPAGCTQPPYDASMEAADEIVVCHCRRPPPPLLLPHPSVSCRASSVKFFVFALAACVSVVVFPWWWLGR
jgi:hypothetical protein